MLLVQKYLLTHSLQQLQDEHGVYCRFSTQNPLKFSLNYDQLEAKDADPISQECRGLVLMTNSPISLDDIVGNTKVLAFGMKRFFNYGQESAAHINLDSAIIYEKLDGSLINLYFDPSLMQWCVATRSVPDADLNINGFSKTFTELFWESCENTVGTNRISFQQKLSSSMNYVFELCTPENTVVVQYNDYKIYLIAARDLVTLNEVQINNLGLILNVPLPQVYNIKSMENLMEFVSTREPSKYEGVVMCDHAFNRVKLKNPGYLALNRIKDSMAKSPRAMLEVILLGQEDDVIPLLPEVFQTQLTSLKEKLVSLIHKIDEEYTSLYSDDRKTFALRIQNGSNYLAPQMMRWSGKCKDMKNWIQIHKKDGTWNDSFLDHLLKELKNLK